MPARYFVRPPPSPVPPVHSFQEPLVCFIPIVLGSIFIDTSSFRFMSMNQNQFQDGGGGSLLPHQAILRHQQGIHKFNSVLTLSTWR